MKRLLTAAFLLTALTAGPALAGWEEAESAFKRQDWTQAVKELRPLAQAGNHQAQGRLGYILLNGLGTAANQQEAIPLLTSAAEKGDALAQFALGSAYFQGKGVTVNRDQALIWFMRAADQGQGNALNNLGQIYFQGIGVPKNETKALEYLRKAADKGISASWETIGVAYWHGRGVPVDRNQAVGWLKKAAEKGHMTAQNLYGAALWGGDGTDKDQAQAVQWFIRSGNQGDAPSLYNAGIAYKNGIGVQRDPEQALYYMALAAKTAKARDKAKMDDALAKAKLEANPDQEKRALAKVAAWRPHKDAGQAASGQDHAVSKGQETALPRPQRSSGSGFVVASDGMVLTNSHVVKSCRNIQISIGDNPQSEAAVVTARDEANDLALLKTTIRPSEVAAFRDGPGLRSGDEVVVVGFPLSSLLSREPNITAGVISAMAGIRGDKRHYQLTAPIQKGNSGGPVVDTSGNVVGVVVATLNVSKVAGSGGAIPQNVNFAIKGDLARKFLTDNSVAYQTASPTSPMSTADVGAKVRKVTAYIQCDG
jgi:TPR repeat protein